MKFNVLFIVCFSFFVWHSNSFANNSIQWKTLDVEVSNEDANLIAAKTQQYIDSKECSTYEDGMNVSEGTFFEAVNFVTPLIELPGGHTTFQSTKSLKVHMKIQKSLLNASYKLSSDKLFIEKDEASIPVYFLTNKSRSFRIDVTFETLGEPKQVQDPRLFFNCIQSKKPNRNGDFTESEKQDCRNRSKKLESQNVVLPMQQSTLNLYHRDIQIALGRAVCLKTAPSVPVIFLD